MKNLKLSIIAFVTLFLGVVVFVGCSNEDTSVDNDSDFSVLKREGISSEVSIFLDSFYSTDYKFGKQIETSSDNDDYVVTEVVVNEDRSARGYITTEKLSGKFIYFVDVDRVFYKLTAVDIVEDKTEVFNDIDKNINYFDTDEFDFISIVYEANNNTAGRKFWGSVIEPGACGPNTNGTPGCFRGFIRTYYVLWMETSSGHLLDSNGHPVTEACDCP